MKSFMNYFKNALICTIVLGVLCSVVYPAALTLAIDALERSLLSLESVEEVRFLVDGEFADAYGPVPLP